MNKKDSIILPIIEIILMVFIIIIAYITVNNYNNSLNNDYINNNLSIKIDNNNNTLYVLNDIDAIQKLENNVINISNYNNENTKYKLIMKIKKDRQLDYKLIKIKIDDQIFSLDNKYIKEDNNYLYFDLTHQNIDKEDEIKFIMWLNEEVKDPSDYIFSYNFYVETI